MTSPKYKSYHYILTLNPMCFLVDSYNWLILGYPWQMADMQVMQTCFLPEFLQKFNAKNWYVLMQFGKTRNLSIRAYLQKFKKNNNILRVFICSSFHFTLFIYLYFLLNLIICKFICRYHLRKNIKSSRTWKTQYVINVINFHFHRLHHRLIWTKMQAKR